MGSIVCQSCDEVIEYYEDEKVSVLYGKCCHECDEQHGEDAV